MSLHLKTCFKELIKRVKTEAAYLAETSVLCIMTHKTTAGFPATLNSANLAKNLASSSYQFLQI